jgi:hypothetical protein
VPVIQSSNNECKQILNEGLGHISERFGQISDRFAQMEDLIHYTNDDIRQQFDQIKKERTQLNQVYGNNLSQLLANKELNNDADEPETKSYTNEPIIELEKSINIDTDLPSLDKTSVLDSIPINSIKNTSTNDNSSNIQPAEQSKNDMDTVNNLSVENENCDDLQPIESVNVPEIDNTNQDEGDKSINSTMSNTKYPKLPELKSIAKSKGLSSVGNKKELIQRLLDSGYIF